jgi:AraC-like DNA-binding protein
MQNTDKDIPKFSFHNSTNPNLGFEIIPFKTIIDAEKQLGHKPHKIDFYQLLYFTKGTGCHKVDFTNIPYSPGTIIPVAKDQVQQFDATAGTEGFAVLFENDFLISEINDTGYLFDFVIFTQSIAPANLKLSQELEYLFHILSKEQDNPNGFMSTEHLRNSLKNFLILLEREKRTLAGVPCEDTLLLYGKFRRLVENELKYAIRVNDITIALGVSMKKLNEATKLYGKSTPKEYIDNRLILEAKRLISFSDMPVKAIAYELGFDEPTNFTKFFKARTGKTPKQFKNGQIKSR